MDKTIEDKINIYRVKKSAQYIVYNCYGSNYGDDAFTIDYLNLFREIIKHLAEDEALIDKVVNNINEYLVKARDIKDEYRDERIKIINDIIRIINTSSKEKYLTVYREELANRRSDTKYLTKYPDYIIEKEIDNVNLSMANDYFVLLSHSDFISDEEFLSNYLPYLIRKNVYYESIISILEEEPLVFKNLTFYNRMICVFNMNTELNNTNRVITKLNKNLVKKIKKEIKKV